MKVENVLDQIHTSITHRWYLQLFTVFTRCLLGIAFIPPSIPKILHRPFTALPDSNPVGHYFNALLQTGFYYEFVGWSQLIAAILCADPANCSSRGFDVSSHHHKYRRVDERSWVQRHVAADDLYEFRGDLVGCMGIRPPETHHFPDSARTDTDAALPTSNTSVGFCVRGRGIGIFCLPDRTRQSAELFVCIRPARLSWRRLRICRFPAL
jgi:hypothetical protein